MRIHICIKSENTVIPFDHQPLLTGTIHKWLGPNIEHGDISLYSFSQLTDGKASPNGLFFKKNSSFFFSAYNTSLIKQLISGIQKDPSMFNHLEVKEIVLQEDPDFSNRDVFFPASPIFIKRKLEDRIEHILYNDSRAGKFLKETLITKLTKAGLTVEEFEIVFNPDWTYTKTKKINYKGINNKANWCPVVIKANSEIKKFAWNVGLGNSTGIGFGAIK